MVRVFIDRMICSPAAAVCWDDPVGAAIGSGLLDFCGIGHIGAS
jgi:hypothetical protein